MGVKERYEKRKKDGEKSVYNGVKQRYLSNSAEDAASSISDRVNTWLKNHDTYISNYRYRYGDRKNSYDDSYVSDSGSYLDTVTKQKSAFDAEADSILSYMDQYKDYFNSEWVDSVRNAISSARDTQKLVVEGATSDNDWWNSFGTDELVKQYGSAEKAYQYFQRDDGYRKKYSGMKYDDIQEAMKTFETNRSDEISAMESDLGLYKELSRWEQDELGTAKLQQLRQKYGSIDDLEKAIYEKKMAAPSEEEQWLTAYQDELYKGDSNYMSKAASGYKSYEAQKIAEQEAKAQEEASKTWWDKAADFIIDSNAFGPTTDNPTLDLMMDTRELYAEDTSYREPNDEWSTEEKNRFGYLWTEDKQKAYAYAEQVNNQIKEDKYNAQQQGISDLASKDVTGNFFNPLGTSGKLGTLGAIASAPFAMGDFMDNLIEYSARGTITQKDYLTPFEMGQAAQSGISNKLNEAGTLNEDIPIFGGKGWGDIYSLGVSTANSMLSALAFGGAGTLVNFIGQGGAAGVDDALSRGATAEQALMYGTIVGSLEGLTEMIPAEQLIKAGSSATFKNWLKKALQQGVGEFFEEGASSFFGNLADDLIMKDKSNYNLMVKQLMQSNPGMSAEEAATIAFKQMAGDIAYDAIGGAVSGFASGGITGAVATAVDARKGKKANIEAKKQYGEVTSDLIQEGLQSDPNSESYQLAQKYQKQVDGKKSKDGKEVKKGKELSGFQIRNLVAANDAQFAVEDFNEVKTKAKDRLKELGENASEIYNIAELVAKRVSGQELTRSEKSTLANSFGSQVAKEFENAQQAENGTKPYNVAYKKPEYKSLTDRVGDDARFGVSESGQATIRGTDETIDINSLDVATVGNGQMTFKTADGNEVSAGQIDFADESQSYLVSAVSDIEHITPPAATAVIHDIVDRSKPLSPQLNGIDEAYTYGYNNYSVEDMKAGNLVSNLTSQQMMSAYKLGQSARAISDEKSDAPIVQMRTAKQAALSKKEMVAQQKARFKGEAEVYFMDGSNVVKFDESGVQLDESNERDQRILAGVNTAKFLSKLGIGGKYYFYQSYLKGNTRYYKDANGVEKPAPNGFYTAEDGSIYIDLNAGNEGQGTTLYTLGHELTHFVKDKSKKQFKILGELVTEAFDKTDMSMHDRVVEMQNQLSALRDKRIDYTEAYEEVVADAMSTMLSDGSFYDKIMEIKGKDKGLFNSIKEFFENLIAKFKEIYAGLTPDQRDAQDIQQMKDMFDRIQTAFAEALVEASENFHVEQEVGDIHEQMSNEEAFQDSKTAVMNQIRPPYSDGSKAFNEFVDELNPEARKTFDLFYGFYQKSRITNTLSVSGKKVKAVNISSLYLLAQEWNDMLAKEQKWADAAQELANFLPENIRNRMNMNEDGTLNPTTLEKEFKMPSSMAQRLVDALAYETIDATYQLGDKTITLPEGKARQSVGGEAYRRAIIDETRRLYADGKLRKVGIGTMSKDRWGSLGFLAANGKTGASGDFTTVCPQMMFNRGCWYCYRRAAMEKGVNNKLVAQSVWYTGEILRIKDSDIEALNRNGGLRIQSFGDWMPHFSAMLADVLYDAELRGLQVKIITKEPSMINYIAALREQGIGKNLYFNLSADYTIERGPAKQAWSSDSLNTVNPERPYTRTKDDGFWWKRAMTVEEANKYREKYPWVNTRIVATTTEEFIRGLKDSRVDVVTGYHGNIREFERVDSTTGEHKVNVEALGDAGMPRFAVNLSTGEWVTEYEGKTATHKRLAQAIAENNLQREYYIKSCCITGRCASCESKCGKYAKDFNVKNATNRDAESIAYWQQQMRYAIKPEFGDMTTKAKDGVKNSDRISEGYDTKNLEWAIENGIINESDQARFWEAIAEIQKLKYNSFARTKNGAYIIETKDKMMFTDGNFKAPTLSKVICFTLDGGKDVDDTRRMIRDEAERTGRTDKSVSFAEGLYGSWFIAEYNARYYHADARQDGQGERTDSQGIATESEGRGVRHGGAHGLLQRHNVGQDFLADDQLKGNYTVSEISEMFDAWNGDAELTELSKRVFAKLQEIMDGQKDAYWATPYPIRFKSDAYLQKAYYIAPNGIFEPSRTDGNYGITYNLDYFRKASDQDKARILLHEAIHACTVGAIKSAERRIPKYADPMEFTPDDSWSDTQKAALELIQVFSQVRVANERNEYGQKNVHEMVAEMSNPEFRAMLKKQSLWGTIVDAIKRIFGIQPRTAYDAVSDALERILELNVPKTETVKYSDRVLMGSLFSGGGTLEAGLAYQMIDKQFGVEYDGKIASVYADNHGDHIQVGRVEDFDISKFDDIFYLHASPVCHNFSTAKHGAKELQMDIDSAKATAKHLETAMPQVFTVENAPGYRKSESLKIITDKLTELGYKWDVDVYNSADYGSATSRNRVILRAVKDGELPKKPTKQERTNSWDKVTRDLWGTLPKAELRPSFISAIENTPKLPILDANGKVNVNKPLLILTTNSGHQVTYCWEGEVCPTLTTKCGEARLVMPDGNIYSVTPEFMGRIQGLPADYKYPKEKTRAFTIIGNGIPTHLTKAVVGGVLDSAYEQTHDGKTLYSERNIGDASNRHLLANAFEGISKSSIEYSMIQEYKGHIEELNKLDEKLSDINQKINKMLFDKETPRDSKKLKELQDEAKEVAKEINRYDKRLLNMEASEPLRKVIDRERKKEAQKTKDHVKEIQENKKVRAEQTELRHKIRKAIRDLDKILKHGNKQKNVKEDLLPVVTKALQSADILFTDNYGTYDMLRNGIGADLSDAEEALVATCTRMLQDLDKMPTDGYDNFQARQEAERKLSYKMSNLKDVFARERKRLNSIKVSTILGELADAYASLEKSEQSYVQGAYSEAVHNFLNSLKSEVGGTIVKDMTKDQLEYVYTAYKMVLTTVRKANQMHNEGLKMSREQLGNAVIQEVMNAGGVHGLWTKAEVAASRADWNNMKPIWVANRIGSETFGKLMQGLFQGQYNFAVDVEEAKQFKLSMDEKYKPRSWDAEKLYGFESSTGKKFSLNLQQIMSLYAFSKREQAYSHLLNGGFVFEGNSTVIVDEKGRKKTYIHNGATSYKLNEANLNEIISSLTKEQKAYVDEMQKYLSEVMGAKGNEVSMALYGIKMFKEQFYFPLRSSGAYMERAKEAEMKKQQGQINLVNSGFTHAVKPEAKNPIILANFMDVWAEHCNEMSMYHSMVLPMEDFRKVYNYSTVHSDEFDSASVYQTIQDAYGDAATAYIDQLYRELNAGATIDPRETTFKKLISNFKKTAVMLSASVVVQQFSSIGRAYALIDPKYFIGTRVNSDTQLSVAEEMRKYAPVAIIKEMGGFDTGTKGSAKSYIMAEKYGKGERRQGFLKDEQYRSDLMGILPAKADEKVWCAIWEAVKRETKAKYPKMDVKSEEFLKLAGERFSEVIEKTQVYDSVLARSANMRSKTGLMQMATSFMAEPTTTVNLLEDAIRRGDKKHMARVFGAVAVSIVLNNALASIVYAMRDDDEDETFIEKYFQSFTSGMIDDINPMSYYPFLKDVYSLFQGYDVERADMSVIADLRDALKKAISLIGKDTSGMDDDDLAKHYKTVNSAILSLLDAGCSVFGVPLKNVRRDANGIINAFSTISKDLTDRDTSWNSFWDKVGSAAKDTIPIYAWTKDESKADKLYEAIVSGDKAYLARLKSTYKTDSAYQSAVRKALRENDSRIHEAAQAKYEGKTEEYKRIFRQIQKEGKFSFDDIMSAINSEEAKIRNGLEPDKVTSSYTASGFVEAVILGDSKSAEAMKEDIIAAKVANGKTPADAEKEFTSAVATGIHDAYSSGLLDEAGAENMLMEYAGKDEEEAASKVNYWAFCEEHPQYELTESNVADYQEFAEPAEISLDIFVQYINGTKGLATKYDQWGDVEQTVREQTLEVIDSLPLTWQQKDALYLAAGYSESKIWDVPW
jgi:site-specific DNA-cytosine methylase